LALPCALEEHRDDAQQDAHQRLGGDRRRGASSHRRNDAKRHGHPAADRDSDSERQPRERHEHRDTGRDPCRALDLKPGDRNTRSAHHRDHGNLELEAVLGEAVADGDQEHRGEHADRERHGQRLAVQPRDRVAVGAAQHHHEDHCPAEWTQHLSLAVQTLLRSRRGLRFAFAIGD
jgi:hypothetical protein